MKTINILKCALIICIACITHTLSAQSIRGKVVNEQQQPVAFANVVMRHMPDSTFVSGCVTDEQGEFKLSDTSRRATHVAISFIGYEAFISAIPQGGDIGTIVMKQNNRILDEVVIKANLPRTQLKKDALVTNIQGTPLAHAGTATDVLGQVPGVIKNNGGIEVLGKGSPLIYINGRQMRNSSELDQLNSAQIKEVEVVTTPGAGYAASVNAVIRIHTLKPIGEGWGFDSRTMLGVHRYVYGTEEVNFNWRKKKVDVLGMVAYENNKSREFIGSNQDTYGTKQLHQINNNLRYQRNALYAGKLGLNYTFNEQHSIGMIYDFSYKPTDADNNSYTSLWIDNAMDDELTNNNRTDGRQRQHLISSYYAGKLGKWQIEANADVLWNSKDDDQKINEISVQSSNRAFSTNSDADSKLIAAKTVLSRGIGKGQLSLGTEWSFAHRTDDYLSGEEFISDSHTKIDENNGAFFVEISQQFGKLMAVAGLRWEHVDSKYYDNGKKQEEQSRIYDNLFPSLSLAYPLGYVRTRLSYSRKVIRPAYSQLNSNVQYVNRYTYQSGNPFLKPAYRDNISLITNYKWITLMLEYTRLSDYIMSVYTQYRDNPEIALLQKQNAKSYDQWTAMLNLSPSFGKYHPQVMVGLIAQTFDIQFNNKPINMDNPLGIFRFNNAINLPFDSWLNADFSWRTNGNSENLYLESSWQFDLGLYKSFGKDKWSIKLQCTDLLKTANTGVIIYNDIRKMYIAKTLDTRNIQLTVRYKFNAAKSKYRGTGAGASEKGRF